MINTNYKNFYKNFYLRTGGFIPTKPLNKNIYPGDFFQIQNGELVVLGNIFSNQIIDTSLCNFDNNTRLNPANWKFQEGVTKPFTGRGVGNSAIDGAFEYSKQVISFLEKGNFMFKANEPESVRILNWSEIQQQLIIKLTQTYYSFREVYVVTEIASAANWTLAIASDQKAELEIAAEGETGLIDVFGNSGSKILNAKDIEYYHREDKRKPSFFKAKKLVVQPDQSASFINALTVDHKNQNEWAKEFYNFQYDDDSSSDLYNGTSKNVLDMLKANELNPNTALLYFKWADANLDDIEKFFISY